jgi:hypothetical protein
VAFSLNFVAFIPRAESVRVCTGGGGGGRDSRGQPLDPFWGPAQQSRVFCTLWNLSQLCTSAAAGVSITYPAYSGNVACAYGSTFDMGGQTGLNSSGSAGSCQPDRYARVQPGCRPVRRCPAVCVSVSLGVAMLLVVLCEQCIERSGPCCEGLHAQLQHGSRFLRLLLCTWRLGGGGYADILWCLPPCSMLLLFLCAASVCPMCSLAFRPSLAASDSRGLGPSSARSASLTPSWRNASRKPVQPKCISPGEGVVPVIYREWVWMLTFESGMTSTLSLS